MTGYVAVSYQLRHCQIVAECSGASHIVLTVNVAHPSGYTCIVWMQSSSHHVETCSLRMMLAIPVLQHRYWQLPMALVPLAMLLEAVHGHA